MSGEPESQLNEKRIKIERLLKEYAIKVGLGVVQPTNEVEKYINLSTPELRKMSAEECGEAAYIIGRAMTYLQLETNKIQADINWANQYLTWLIAPHVMNVGTQYTPMEYRKVLAIKNNDVAMKLQTIIVEAQLRIDSMAFMSTQLRVIATALESLQQTKRNQK